MVVPGVKLPPLVAGSTTAALGAGDAVPCEAKSGIPLKIDNGPVAGPSIETTDQHENRQERHKANCPQTNPDARTARAWTAEERDGGGGFVSSVAGWLCLRADRYGTGGRGGCRNGQKRPTIPAPAFADRGSRVVVQLTPKVVERRAPLRRVPRHPLREEGTQVLPHGRLGCAAADRFDEDGGGGI